MSKRKVERRPVGRVVSIEGYFYGYTFQIICDRDDFTIESVRDYKTASSARRAGRRLREKLGIEKEGKK